VKSLKGMGYNHTPPWPVMPSADNLDLRALSEMHDARSLNTFISIYANLEQDLNLKFLEQRHTVCRSILKGNNLLVENFEKGFAQAIDRLRKLKGRPGVEGVAIFCSPMNDLFEFHELMTPVKDHVVVDSSPYVRPLTKLADEWETTALALVDQQNFKLFVLSLSSAEKVGSDSEQIMGRHKKGGCSQARFQRLRKGAIKEFLEEAALTIAEMMEREKLENLIIAGPGNAKKDLMDYLNPHARKKVVSVIDHHFKASHQELFDKAQEAIQAEERTEELERIEELKGEILTEGLAVYGLRETRDAVMAGQVETLLVSQGFTTGGWKCEACQLFDLGHREGCRSCSRPVTEIDFIEELTEYVHRTDGEVDFVMDSDDLEALGGVAALLRYK